MAEGMTLRIEKSVRSGRTVLALSGRLGASDLPQLEELLEGGTDRWRIVLDLTDVKLADRDAVRCLVRCEADGVTLEHCPAYIREWMRREVD
jgi:hypothetical protein